MSRCINANAHSPFKLSKILEFYCLSMENVFVSFAIQYQYFLDLLDSKLFRFRICYRKYIDHVIYQNLLLPLCDDMLTFRTIRANFFDLI